MYFDHRPYELFHVDVDLVNQHVSVMKVELEWIAIVKKKS